VSDRYTDRETALKTILATELGSTYTVSNKISMNLGAGANKYNVLVQWLGFGNEINSGTTCFQTDRERYRIICCPIAGATDDTVNEQLNIMAAAVIDVLRDYSKVNAATVDSGECLTQFRVDSVEKGYYQKRLSVQIEFSFLVDEG